MKPTVQTGLALGLFGAVLCGAFWTPHPPNAQSFRELALEGPSLRHWLGVDGMGRDFASRLWAGSAHTVLYGTGASLISFLLSILLLVLHRSLPEKAGSLIPSLIGLWVAFPVLFVGLLLLVFLNPSPPTLLLAVGLGNVPFTWRQLRILWHEHRNAPHVVASRVIGNRGWPLFREAVWPNLRGEIGTVFHLVLAFSILELSGLAFLGLVGDPDFAELGSILKQNQPFLYQAPVLVFLPGALLSLLLLVIYLGPGPARKKS